MSDVGTSAGPGGECRPPSAGAEASASSTPGSAEASGKSAELILRHYQAIYRYAYRLTGQVADAEDLTQQTFLLAHKHVDQLRDPSKSQNWLYSILRTCYLKSLRKPPPIPAVRLQLDVDQIPADSPLLDEVDGERLQLAINQLPDALKLVLLMFYFENCSYKEIAEELQIPIGTVMSRLSRAKGHLRAMLLVAEARTP